MGNEDNVKRLLSKVAVDNNAAKAHEKKAVEYLEEKCFSMKSGKICDWHQFHCEDLYSIHLLLSNNYLITLYFKSELLLKRTLSNTYLIIVDEYSTYCDMPFLNYAKIQFSFTNEQFLWSIVCEYCCAYCVSVACIWPQTLLAINHRSP